MFFTDAEDWGYLMADISIDAVSVQKQLSGVEEKEYCRRALEGMRDRIRMMGITVEGVTTAVVTGFQPGVEGAVPPVSHHSIFNL